VAGSSAENLHANGALLHLVGIAGQGLLNHKAQQGRVSFALGEKRMNQKKLKLSLDRISIRLRQRHPRLQRGARSVTGIRTGLRMRSLGEIQGFNLLRDRMIRSISVSCPL